MGHKKEIEVYMLNESHCEPLRLESPLATFSFLTTFVLLLGQPLAGFTGAAATSSEINGWTTEAIKEQGDNRTAKTVCNGVSVWQ